MRIYSKLVLLGVTALAISCSSNPGPVEPGIGGAGAAGGSDRPTVSSDGGLGAGYDAPVYPDTNTSTDTAVKLDAKKSDAAGATDALGEAGSGDPELCSLLTQNCPNKQACYPFGKGGSRCAVAGDAEAGVKCASDSDCVKGAICGVGLNALPVCVTICERGFQCGGRANSCAPVQGYSAIGYCLP